MKLFRSLIMLAFVLGVGAAAARAQGGTETPLTNTAVIRLARAGFREKTLIAIIRSRPTRFDLSPERLIELKKGGVTERVILAMIEREQTDAVARADWGDEDDDGFFSGGPGPNRGASPSPNSGGTDIFGSSGGASGSTRGNGGRGGVENDTQTTGSVTARIIRPPTESGGAAQPKLERTPTLTNDSVVELIEAGFTEGTIIRRIENSPVEFDLSPARLEELRKRRVTEAVIAAMRAAMGEGVEPARKPER
jgi:hypothetical protein